MSTDQEAPPGVREFIDEDRDYVLDLEALLAFRDALGAVEDVAKTQVADTGKYKYTYANLGDVLDECKRACELHGLAITQTATEIDGKLAVYTTLIHKGGGTYQPQPLMLPLPREAQSLGSALTYLRRYALLTIFGIAPEDDDGALASKREMQAEAHGGYRSGAEERIHAEFTKLAQDGEDDVGKIVRAKFRVAFGVGLSELPVSKHGDALEWVLGAIPLARQEIAEAVEDQAADKVDATTEGASE